MQRHMPHTNHKFTIFPAIPANNSDNSDKYSRNYFGSGSVIKEKLAVSVRRLHDIGKGGGWIFISLVPLIGGIWYLVLMLLPSQPGGNRFGSQPN